MTENEAKLRVSSHLKVMLQNGLWAENHRVSDPKDAKTMAKVAYHEARRASKAAAVLNTDGVKRLAEVVAGQAAIYLRDSFQLEE